jgi:hypothetical protein
MKKFLDRRSLPKIIVTVVAIVLTVLHVVVPAIKIDTITLILLVIAALPWFLPYIKGFEIPGVVKITLPDTKAATDKVSGDTIIKMKPAQLRIKGHVPKVTVGPRETPPFEMLHRVYEEDPNLALVGFRIEIEKRLIRLAEAANIPTERTRLHKLVRNLVRLGVVSESVASGLMELIALGNQAAHGASVAPEAAKWMLDIGPGILRGLEDIDENP